MLLRCLCFWLILPSLQMIFEVLFNSWVPGHLHQFEVVWVSTISLNNNQYFAEKKNTNLISLHRSYHQHTLCRVSTNSSRHNSLSLANYCSLSNLPPLYKINLTKSTDLSFYFQVVSVKVPHPMLQFKRMMHLCFLPWDKGAAQYLPCRCSARFGPPQEGKT